MPKNCTDEQIKDMLLAGCSVGEITVTLKCGHLCVERVRDAAGISHKVKNKPLTLHQRAKIVAMLKEGGLMRQIAREVGCTGESVRYYRDKLRTPEQWAELRRYRESNAPSVRDSGLPAGDYWAGGDVADTE